MGTFMSPIRVYDRKVYALTDIAVLDVGDRTIKGDGSISALQTMTMQPLECKVIEVPLENKMNMAREV